MKFMTPILFLFSLVSAVSWALAREAEPQREPLPGQIVIDPDHPEWLMRHGGSHLFICGPGDPEGFLYRGTRNSDGTRTGDQAELIDKLVRHGGNCIYMQMVRTHGGDAKQDPTHNPFIDSDPDRGLDEGILAQWEEWFALMDRNGILIYLYFYDDGAEIWDTGERVGAAEQAFFEGIVRRFRHHRNLIWVIGEESEERYPHARVNALAEIIRRNDHAGRVIGNHHLNGTTFKAWQPGSALNHFAMQMRAATGEAAHAYALDARRNAGGRYQVIYSESTQTPPEVEAMRRHAWGVAMAGMMPMLLQMDIAGTPAEALAQCRHLQRFFEATDFFRLEPHDELKQGETKYVLAAPGRSYIAYADQLQDELGLEGVPAGRCVVSWVDCRSGATLTEERAIDRPGQRGFRKPAGFGPECAAWIRFPDIAPAAIAARGAAAADGAGRANEVPVASGQRVVTRPGSEVYIQLGFTDDGPGPYTYTIVSAPRHGTLSGENNDRTYAPAAGFTGRDEFTWRVHDGRASSAEAKVIIEVRAPSATAIEPGETQRIGSGYTPGIATERSGTVHLVTMHDGAILHRERRPGAEFGPAEELPLPEGRANYNSPHVVCGADGTVHVVFERDATKASRKAWYTSRRGGTWMKPVLAIERTEPGRRVNYPRLTLEGDSAWVSAFTAGGSTVVKLTGLGSEPRVRGRIDTRLWVAHAFPREGQVLVIGRAGASGHKLERYDAQLRPVGEPLLLSRGTPTKTYESTAVIMDPAGVIHVAGTTGAPAHRLWYTTDRRAAEGREVILGPEFGEKPGEFTYPVMARDHDGRIFLSYRDHTTGEARLVLIDPTRGFSPPVTLAGSTTRRLRWNPHLAPAAGGGVHVVWDDNGEVFFRTVRVGPRAGS